MNSQAKIQVLGSGCPSCKRLYETVKEVAALMGLPNEIEYSTDIQKILEMNVMSTPVLAVDGKPILTGSVPKKEQIMKLLTSSIG